MTRALRTLVLVGMFGLVSPGVSLGGEVLLLIKDGRVMLSAQNASLRAILAEWERVGGTRFINADKLPPELLTIDLVNVSESKALDTLLRSTGGYAVVLRSATTQGASDYERILIAPGRTSEGASFPVGGVAPRSSASAGRPEVQSRVLADGKVVRFIEDPSQPGGITLLDADPENPNPGGEASQAKSGTGNSDPGRRPQAAEQGQQSADAFDLSEPARHAKSGAKVAPGAPAAQPSSPAPVGGPRSPTTPPPPPKPPGR